MKILKSVLFKFIKMIIGFILCAIGIVMTINANLGLSPWDVLHEGIYIMTGITMGKASIAVGILVVLANIILGENVGWATIINMVLVGILMDVLMLNNLIPIADSFMMGLIMMILGMFILGIGCVLYLSTGFGSGPRDGMMVAIQKKTGKSLSLIRNTMEVLALIVGYLLGGTVGIGTVISAFGLGYCIQIAFKICKFDGTKVQHRYIIDDINYLKNHFNKKDKNDEKIAY
ncbi:MAG: YczE/YyaS/YitT family protein [Peptostreptococcaceae bacterium]